jgi:aminoglycoside phosphotransferase
MEQPLFETPTDPAEYFTPFQQAVVLSVCPPGTVLRAVAFTPQFTPKGPALVSVLLPDGSARTLVVKLSRSVQGVVTEARLFPVLARLGLPVPAVLAGPVYDPANPRTGPVLVMSCLPGADLQRLSGDPSLGPVGAGRLVIEGISRLHALTEAVRREAIGRQLPQNTLLTELRLVVERGGPWLQAPLFQQAVWKLLPALAAITTPLVFTNGDAQPANFLSDGQRVTGFVDFEMACFEDPYYGVAKYRVYDMYPFHKTGFVERYLTLQGLSEAQFAPRMAVRCLWTLQREIPVSGGDGGYRDHVLNLLNSAFAYLS